MKKKTIHFNDETLKELSELISILGVEGYGYIPKALKFSITFTIQELKRHTKVLPDLNEAELELYLHSIKSMWESSEGLKMGKKE